MGRDRNKLPLCQRGRQREEQRNRKDPERTEVKMERERGKIVDFLTPPSLYQFKRMVSEKHFL